MMCTHIVHIIHTTSCARTLFKLFTPRLACNGYVTQGDDRPTVAGKPDPDAVFYAAARAWSTHRAPAHEQAHQRDKLDKWAYDTCIPSADWSPDLHTSPPPLDNVMIYRYP